MTPNVSSELRNDNSQTPNNESVFSPIKPQISKRRLITSFVTPTVEQIKRASKENDTFVLDDSLQVHTDNMQNIIDEFNADCVLLSGETADYIEADIKAVTIKAKKEGSIKGEYFPEVVRWRSPEKGTSINALIYKHLTERLIRKTAVIANNCYQVLEVEELKRLGRYESPEIDLEKVNLQDIFNNGAYGIDVYRKMRNIPWQDLPDNLKGAASTISEIYGHIDYLLQAYPERGELRQDLLRIIELQKRTESGEGKIDDPEITDVMDNPVNVSDIDDRIALVRVLYPEFIKGLIKEDGTPKKIAFYDTAAVSGKKFEAYFEFMQRIGIPLDNLHFYSTLTDSDAVKRLEQYKSHVNFGRIGNFKFSSVEGETNGRSILKTHDEYAQAVRVIAKGASQTSPEDKRNTYVLKLAKILDLEEA